MASGSAYAPPSAVSEVNVVTFPGWSPSESAWYPPQSDRVVPAEKTVEYFGPLSSVHAADDQRMFWICVCHAGEARKSCSASSGYRLVNADSNPPAELLVIGRPGRYVAVGQSERFSQRAYEVSDGGPPYAAACSANMIPSKNGGAGDVRSGPPPTSPLKYSASVPDCRYASQLCVLKMIREA